MGVVNMKSNAVRNIPILRESVCLDTNYLRLHLRCCAFQPFIFSFSVVP